ncbi:serine/threonine-protein kinase HipA [Quadrisphaera granulorum]|uniref:Serine/threonine-protein kinase HipA n=1 Tax=Quadrisphaera granulorum TaxID=317664 RepID=A0A315ZSY4_9ACTN|nr:HipA domain-containing protein [Quadrisphaera granulorum]PWJ48665.1 serine/threonine-protein kinase HipA [Quadrisphaera granulorum]SZE98387.1 serine/threonine-protein kinase HipA [Quadrisphaera granulorum]
MTRADLWLHGVRLAELTETGERIDLRWTPEGAERHLGQTVLSLNLPVTEPDRPPHHRKVRPFLAGLLPEPQTAARHRLERRLGTTEVLQLLKRSGGDVAGAVRLSAPGEQPGVGSVEHLSDDDVALLLTDPQAAATLGGGSSDALPGVQHKVVLRSLEDGAWGIARHGASSTHILKPRNGPLSLELEAFGAAVSAEAGLTDTPSWIQTIGGVEALVIPRYDRHVQPDGIVRLHQEDMAQALGLNADDLGAKFQRGRRYPSLAAMAGKLKASGGDVEPLARLTALNVLLGNTDAHAKNHSVLLDERGRARLAPAYDVAPLLSFGTTRFALDIAGHQLVDQVDRKALESELRSWAGASSQRSIDHVAAAIDGLASSTSGVVAALPHQLLDDLRTRAAAFTAAHRGRTGSAPLT